MMPRMRPPLPPFTEETARQKVQAAEDAWNTLDPARVAQAYTPDSQWRNRDEFFDGRDEIIAFLERKWGERELDYGLRKDLWAFHGNRIAVRFRDRPGASTPRRSNDAPRTCDTPPTHSCGPPRRTAAGDRRTARHPASSDSSSIDLAVKERP
jgi:hypothetical protein